MATKMAAVTYYKDVSQQLNDSLSSAFKLDDFNVSSSFPNLTYEDIDSSCITILDDTLTDDINNTITNRKIRKRAKSADESICFVDEYLLGKEQSTEKNNLNIRSVVVLPQTQKRKRRNSECSDNDEIQTKKFRDDLIVTTPRKIRKSTNLFTSSEQKKNRIYNKNTFNPFKDDGNQDVKRMIILDGSNIAYHHSLGKEFSVKGLEISINYFEKMGHQVKAVVPQYRLQRLKSTDPNKLELLNRNGKIVFTPCKNLPGMNSTCYDDRFILQLAVEFDGAIISNDNYRDLIYENPGFKKIIQNRVIGYTWCNDMFILPKDPYGKYGPHLDDILNRFY